MRAKNDTTRGAHTFSTEKLLDLLCSMTNTQNKCTSASEFFSATIMMQVQLVTLYNTFQCIVNNQNETNTQNKTDRKIKSRSEFIIHFTHCDQNVCANARIIYVAHVTHSTAKVISCVTFE